jgi:hypothetical protein
VEQVSSYIHACMSAKCNFYIVIDIIVHIILCCTVSGQNYPTKPTVLACGHTVSTNHVLVQHLSGICSDATHNHNAHPYLQVVS